MPPVKEVATHYQIHCPLYPRHDEDKRGCHFLDPFTASRWKRWRLKGKLLHMLMRSGRFNFGLDSSPCSSVVDTFSFFSGTAHVQLLMRASITCGTNET